MRKYQPAHGNQVDLDNPKTYKYLPKDSKSLDALMFKEIGYALVYMDYFPSRKGLYPKKKKTPKMVKHPYSNKKVDIDNCSYDQRVRVYRLIKKFADNRHKNYDNIMWLKEQIFLFQDEIENMC